MKTFALLLAFPMAANAAVCGFSYCPSAAGGATDDGTGTLSMTGLVVSGTTKLGNGTGFTSAMQSQYGTNNNQTSILTSNTNPFFIEAANGTGPSIGLGQNNGAASTSGARLGSIAYYGMLNTTSAWTGATFGAAADGLWTGSSAPGRFVWSTTTLGTLVLSEKMRLNSAGQLLISTTTSPAAGTMLSVNGNSLISGTATMASWTSVNMLTAASAPLDVSGTVSSTFSRLAPGNGSAPFSCTTALKGSIAMASNTLINTCNGTSWQNSAGGAALW